MGGCVEDRGVGELVSAGAGEGEESGGHLEPGGFVVAPPACEAVADGGRGRGGWRKRGREVVLVVDKNPGDATGTRVEVLV